MKSAPPQTGPGRTRGAARGPRRSFRELGAADRLSTGRVSITPRNEGVFHGRVTGRNPPTWSPRAAVTAGPDGAPPAPVAHMLRTRGFGGHATSTEAATCAECKIRVRNGRLSPCKQAARQSGRAGGGGTVLGALREPQALRSADSSHCD